ncbi:MAG: type II toxin-antitoxin system Phd/YefM family antitoxin [Alphaproteobacteria bacterium]|nr:type II toxin-antitoxin system Phd/YefM family antitoxin [Alphaproteobacteria bacterium]
MHRVTISDLQRQIGEIQDMALKEPVFVTRNGREKYVFLSSEEYHRLKRRDREVLGVEELNEDDIRDIAAAQVPAEYAYLNDLLDD